MKKKLRLHRTTIANLSGHALSGVYAGITEGNSIQSVVVDGKVEPCQWPIFTETCGVGGTRGAS
jgi:hypothetical protein